MMPRSAARKGRTNRFQAIMESDNTNKRCPHPGQPRFPSPGRWRASPRSRRCRAPREASAHDGLRARPGCGGRRVPRRTTTTAAAMASATPPGPCRPESGHVADVADEERGQAGHEHVGGKHEKDVSGEREDEGRHEPVAPGTGVVHGSQGHRHGDERQQGGRLAHVFEDDRSALPSATQSPTANTPATTRKTIAGAVIGATARRAGSPRRRPTDRAELLGHGRHGRLLPLPHLRDPSSRIPLAGAPCSPSRRRRRARRAFRRLSAPGRARGPTGARAKANPVATASSALSAEPESIIHDACWGPTR